MRHHIVMIPLTAFDPNDDGSGEIEVSFDWSPRNALSGLSGPPENYDPGAGEDFYIVSAVTRDPDGIPVIMLPNHDEQIIAWLDENWERPDHAAERADYLYDQYRDRMMEERA